MAKQIINIFSLNWPHWEHSVIESQCPSVYLFVCLRQRILFYSRPLIDPGITWSVPRPLIGPPSNPPSLLLRNLETWKLSYSETQKLGNSETHKPTPLLKNIIKFSLNTGRRKNHICFVHFDINGTFFNHIVSYMYILSCTFFTYIGEINIKSSAWF